MTLKILFLYHSRRRGRTLLLVTMTKRGGGGGQEKEEETKSSTIANKKKPNRYEGMSDEKIAEIKRIRKEQRRRMKERKKSQARLHFNHVGGIGTTALTPRSIRKVTELFSKITSI